MSGRLLCLLLVAPLCTGCALLGEVQPTQVSGTAAGLFGIPAATVAAQEAAEISQIAAIAAQIQMLKAQLDGSPMPTLPPIAVPPPAPAPLPAPIPAPTPSPAPPATLP